MDFCCTITLHYSKVSWPVSFVYQNFVLLLKTLQSVSSKSAGHIVASDFASHGFLASHSVIKKHINSVLQLSDKVMNKKSHIPFSY